MSEGTQGGKEAGERRWMGLLQVGSLIAVAAVALYFMQAPRVADLGDMVAHEAEGVLRVDVVRPTASRRVPTVEATGTVSLHSHVELRSQVFGRVVWVSPKLRTGGEFKAQEPLLKIDPRDFEIALQRAEARLVEQRAQVTKHQVKEQRERAEYAREHPGEAIPDFVSRAAQVARYEARVERMQGEVELARLALARTTYSLPFDGRVMVSQSAMVGAMVGPGNGFGRAYPKDALELQAAVSLADLATLDPAVGRSAQVRIGDRSLSAKVERVSAGVGPRSRMAYLFLKFSDALPLAEVPGPGVFAHVSITGEPLDDAFVLPDTAERPEGGVWVVSGGTLRSVTPQSFGRDRTGWIVAAFDAGDGVVTGPVPSGVEGLKVEAVVASGGTP